MIRITRAAVDAAANAIGWINGMRFDGFWSRLEDLEPEDSEHARAEALAALVAALPHLVQAEATRADLTELTGHILEGSKRPSQYGGNIVSISTTDALRIADHLAQHGYLRSTP